MKKILFSLLMLCCMTAAWAQDDDFVNVASASQMYNVLSGNAYAKVRLTADIYLSDLGADFGDTFCSTFYGILDGDGHAIKGDHYADNTTQRRNRTYLFTYSDGATFKNLAFKHIRKNSEDHSNQAIITSQAKNGCVFENITFENCGTWTKYDNAGSAAGYAENCTFKDITVKNSDFTVNKNRSGCVVGYAIGCTFTNIKVENCESTSAADELYAADGGTSGGVAGRTDDCTINNVEILGTFIKTYCVFGGGVVGYSEGTQFTNCIVDDQSCVCVDGEYNSAQAYAGGIVGGFKNGEIYNCINSALIAADMNFAGGIAGGHWNSGIVGCLNTGMVIDINMDDVLEGFYNKYKTKTGMTCVTKIYQGKEYVIRKYEYKEGSKEHNNFGGIVGYTYGNVSKCVNYGSVYCPSNKKSVGGIVGDITAGTISDCLSDFSGSEYSNGICLFEKYSTDKVSVDNCLNLTTYKDISAYGNEWSDFHGKNNYSLTTAEDAHHTTKTTAAKIKSGEICTLLGGCWEQNIGTDEYPTPTGNKGVYHTRTVSNQYGTVCLPFPVQSDDNIRYYTFGEAYNDNGDVQLMFDYEEDVIPAGTPLLFRVRNLGENCFNNAGFDSNDWADEPISKDNYDSWDSWNFLGTFSKRDFSTNAFDKYYVSDGVIKNAKQTTVPAYRAYFRGPDIKKLTNSTSGARVRIIIEDEDGETTAISLINENYNENENFGGKAYSLMGTEVNDSYRGIVIRNGKKVLRK